MPLLKADPTVLEVDQASRNIFQALMSDNTGVASPQGGRRGVKGETAFQKLIAEKLGLKAFQSAGAGSPQGEGEKVPSETKRGKKTGYLLSKSLRFMGNALHRELKAAGEKAAPDKALEEKSGEGEKAASVFAALIARKGESFSPETGQALGLRASLKKGKAERSSSGRGPSLKVAVKTIIIDLRRKSPAGLKPAEYQSARSKSARSRSMRQGLRHSRQKLSPVRPEPGVKAGSFTGALKWSEASFNQELPVLSKIQGEVPGMGRGLSAAENPGETPAGRELFKTLQEKMIPEVVQRMGFILKDGGKGEIRLVLKPESLGSVRIRINISDNIVEGRIIVENNIIKEIFESSLDQLKAALKSEGFQTAGLEVSVGNGRTGDQTKEEWSSGRLRVEALEEFEKGIAVFAGFEKEDYLINLVI